MRPSGWLTDLGSPNIFYFNLDHSALKDIETFRELLSSASAAQGLVLDMRGYPDVSPYEIAQHLICHPFDQPHFNVSVLGPEGRRNVVDDGKRMAPLNSPSYCGPLALLVGPSTVSAAETFSTLLVDSKRVTVFGQSSSAGTNGNITGIQLPGRFAFTFTGMQTLHADGSRFHGVGIVPDFTVSISPSDYANGFDPVLERAAHSLQKI
jgi:C-terminal processing protease CtpA/Prc